MRQRFVTIIVFFSCLILAACDNGGGSSAERDSNPNSAIPEVAVDTFPYVAEATYAAALKPCVYQGNQTEQCSLQRLPYIGLENDTPDIDTVMQRLLVSHRWMGDNFRAVLETLPSDLLLMLRSVTAIVVASDIRPSYFRPDTGAIYLDPDYLWLNSAQQVEINQQPDFRSDFGSALQVALPWRFVQNNVTVSLRPGAEDNGSRSVVSLRFPLAFLLYHELAHAVDFMHPSRLASLDVANSPDDYARSTSELKSTALAERFPLNSRLMRELAGVSFAGEQATVAQRQLLAPAVSEEFFPDGAITYYGYSTVREDLATLFDTLMMSFHFGIDEEVAVTNNPGAGAAVDEYIVHSGQRGRISDPAVIERAAWVANELYPGVASDIEAHLRSLPAPRELLQDSAFGSNQFRDSLSSDQSVDGVEKPAAHIGAASFTILPVCGARL